MSKFSDLLEGLSFLLNERLASPEGTRTFRADGEYQKTRGKWVRVKASSGSSWQGKFAPGPKSIPTQGSNYSWSSAFDDREHQKAIEQNRTAEKAHRDEIDKIDQQLGKLKQRVKTASPEQREKLVAKHNELAAKRELHRTVAREARTSSQEITKDLETAKSDRTWQKKAKSALSKSAEREGINVIGRTKIRGSEGDSPTGSTPIPDFVPTPDHFFPIGLQPIAGDPETPVYTPKTLWRPGVKPISYAEPKTKDQFSADYYDKLKAKTSSKPSEPDHPILKALRTIEVGRAYYGDFKNQKNKKLRAALPKAASAISLPMFMSKSMSRHDSGRPRLSSILW